MTTAVNDIQKKYCSHAMLLSIAIAGILILAEFKPLARGLLLGTLFSILNFILIAQTLPLKLNKGRGKTYLICLGSIWLRYLLLAAPLILAAHSERFDFFSAAAGLFTVQVTILLHHFRTIIFKNSGKTSRQIPLTQMDE